MVFKMLFGVQVGFFFFICNWPETVIFSKHENCKLKDCCNPLHTLWQNYSDLGVLMFWLWVTAYSSCHSYLIVCGQVFLIKVNWNTEFSQQRSLVKWVIFYCIMSYSAMLFSSELVIFMNLQEAKKPLGFPRWGFQITCKF